MTWAISTFVDGRAYPMFGLLFGCVVARVAARQSGPPRQTRRLLWRRSSVLIAVGVVDRMLFFVGDVLAAYGVLLSPDLLTQLTDRVPVVALVGPVGFAAPFLLGLWAGRRRILEQPGRHLRLLRTTAVVGSHRSGGCCSAVRPSTCPTT